MATLLQAVRTYGPKLELNRTIQLNEVADWMVMRTGLNKSEAMRMLQELNEAIVYFNRQGSPIKLPGIGTFTPSIDRVGEIRINLRPDMELKRGVNNPGAYSGKITNKAAIGLPNEDLKALWDSDHPEDPLVLNEEPVSLPQ